MTVSNLAGETINAFKDALSPGASVLIENDEGYEESLLRWSDTAIRRAQVVIQPANTEDVSKTVMFAVENKIPFVVKGGGHSCSGASSSEGLVIDLGKNINKVTVNKEKKLVTTGGGALWGDVNRATAEYGLVTVGGSVNHTGVGGLTLGGGYGRLTGQYGLTIDNLESVEIVTADGKIRWASKTENKDLFWGIRGYGKGLGVVTTFVFRGHELTNQVFAGTIAFPGSQLEVLVSAVNKFVETQLPQSVVLFTFGRPAYLGGDALVLLTLFHNGTEEEANSIFSPFFALGPIFQQTSMMPYEKVNSLQNQFSKHGERKRLGSANLRIFSYPIIQRAFGKYVSLAEEYPEAARSAVIFELIHPQGILQHARDEMAFNWRDTNINIMLSIHWKYPKSDAAMAKYMSEMQAILHENGDEKRLYVNYTDGLSETRSEIGDNYERLKILKNKYDPSGVFPKI